MYHKISRVFFAFHGQTLWRHLQTEDTISRVKARRRSATSLYIMHPRLTLFASDCSPVSRLVSSHVGQAALLMGDLAVATLQYPDQQIPGK